MVINMLVIHGDLRYQLFGVVGFIKHDDQVAVIVFFFPFCKPLFSEGFKVICICKTEDLCKMAKIFNSTITTNKFAGW